MSNPLSIIIIIIIIINKAITIRMLLHHAIKFEYGGWRVWVDTLAIVHSKVVKDIILKMTIFTQITIINRGFMIQIR